MLFHLTSFLLSSTSLSLSQTHSGVRRLSLMVEKMLGKKPNLYFRVCWQYLSPMLVLVRKKCWDSLYLIIDNYIHLRFRVNSFRVQMVLKYYTFIPNKTFFS